MNYKRTEVILIDYEDDIIWGELFDSKKEAFAFFNGCAKDRQYWVESAESESFADSIKFIQVVDEDGDLIKEADGWFKD